MEKNFAFPTAGINKIRGKLTWAQLELVPTQNDEFQFIIAGDDESVEELRIDKVGEELYFGQPQLAYAKEILPRRRWLQICVRIPTAWGKEVDVDTISGIIGAHGLVGSEIGLNSVSGSISAKDITSTSIWIHTVSGSISGQDINAKRGNLRSVSGGMALTEYTVESTKLFTISGSIGIEMLSGSKSVDMQTVSGPLSIETDMPVSADLRGLSGHFLRSDGVPETGEGLITIIMSSVSGDLAVKKRDLGRS